MLVCTLGDPHSVNIELLSQLLTRTDTLPDTTLLLGSYEQWIWQLTALEPKRHIPLELVPLEHLSTFVFEATAHEATTQPATTQPAMTQHTKKQGLFFCDTLDPQHKALPKDPRQLSPKERGLIAVTALHALKKLTLAPKSRLAVLTCPIDKHSCAAAGFEFMGQTEYFEDLWSSPATMVLAGSRLRVGLASNHLPLSQVSAALSPEGLCTKLAGFAASLAEHFGINRPRIAVCGLNPHCGEKGLCGDEETRIIAKGLGLFERFQSSSPAATQARIYGPLPADTVFWRALQGDFDGVLAMYHDQGLGPLKTVHFDSAVNLSAGLPHLRVSPDHGPAADLFLRSKASSASFAACWELCSTYLASY